MHLKRNKAIKEWPIARKGTKYVVRARHNLKNSVPLLAILRNLLKIAKTRKEAKKILNSGKVKINEKNIREERFPVALFDILSLNEKNFRLVFKNKKFGLEEVGEKEAGEKIVKVIGKKILKKGKIQINLKDGRNYLSKEKVKTRDSVVVDLKENKVKEVLPFKEGAKIMFIDGKRTGEAGIIEKIDKEKKIIILKVKEGKINSRADNLMVVR